MNFWKKKNILLFPYKTLTPLRSQTFTSSTRWIPKAWVFGGHRGGADTEANIWWKETQLFEGGFSRGVFCFTLEIFGIYNEICISFLKDFKRLFDVLQYIPGVCAFNKRIDGNLNQYELLWGYLLLLAELQLQEGKENQQVQTWLLSVITTGRLK